MLRQSVHKTVNLFRFPSAGPAGRVTLRAYCSPSSLKFSQFSSIHDPLDTLHTKAVDETGRLRGDVRFLGTVLGNVIKASDESVYEKVERTRSLTKKWREGGELEDAREFVSTFSDQDLLKVGRSFAHFLRLANTAEAHNRIRLLDSTTLNSSGPLPDKKDSCGGVIPNLLNSSSSSNISKDSIISALNSQTVQLILTAHPTEVNRKTVIAKTATVQSHLAEADTLREGVTGSYASEQVEEGLKRTIQGLWLSDEVSRFKPTAVEEAARGTLVVSQVLWNAVPSFLRKLSATMKQELGSPLDLTATPVTFGSWMGGDRDGNPNVTPNVTREVSISNRITAAKLLVNDIEGLINELSITVGSEELVGVLEDPVREPYREFLRPVKAKLDRTVEFLEKAQVKLRDSGEATNFNELEEENIYIDTKDLVEELLLLHRSLCGTGCESVADGKLSDVIRNLYAFGMTLVPLDVRQESTRHTEALDCITRYLGVGTYEAWDETTRLSWLQKQLTNKRPLVRRGCWNSADSGAEFFTPAASEVLETFDVIAEAGSGTLGAYVISQASTASDVLAVLLLQRDAGVKSELRVVPLFETLDDLNGAVEVMDTLWSTATYRGAINNKQEIMVGYSDSAKDAGRLAASWAQYETQEKLAELAKKHGIELTFFHGKGGTVGRGGNPATFEAILAHPPSTINGRFRVTEQGEMITQNFGHAKIAERTLDIYTAGLLAEQHSTREKPNDSTRELMNRLSEISVNAYRGIVRDDPRFVPYFRAATPEVELSNLNIGSRPAKRKASGGVESLRAIPWIFAWTQTRLNLPTWLGVGEALSEVLDSEDGPALKHMYENWSSFKTTIDLVEMVLAKSEPEIAKIYENQLVKDPEALELGAEIRKTHELTEKAVLALTGHATLSENNSRLLRGMSVRNPYVDCLNVLQAEVLLRLRELEGVEGVEAEKKLLTDALMISINGVANGMKNTG